MSCAALIRVFYENVCSRFLMRKGDKERTLSGDDSVSAVADVSC
jgi:hypothetical protein